MARATVDSHRRFIAELDEMLRDPNLTLVQRLAFLGKKKGHEAALQKLLEERRPDR